MEKPTLLVEDEWRAAPDQHVFVLTSESQLMPLMYNLCQTTSGTVVKEIGYG